MMWINQQNFILNYLTLSFDTLAPGPRILNLCLLVDPVLKSEEYIKDQSKLAEMEIIYTPMTSTEKNLKAEVDKWIKSQKRVRVIDEIMQSIRSHSAGVLIKTAKITLEEFGSKI